MDNYLAVATLPLAADRPHDLASCPPPLGHKNRAILIGLIRAFISAIDFGLSSKWRPSTAFRTSPNQKRANSKKHENSQISNRKAALRADLRCQTLHFETLIQSLHIATIVTGVDYGLIRKLIDACFEYCAWVGKHAKITPCFRVGES